MSTVLFDKHKLCYTKGITKICDSFPLSIKPLRYENTQLWHPDKFKDFLPIRWNSRHGVFSQKLKRNTNLTWADFIALSLETKTPQ
jgi:hypothetical protein